MKVPPLYVNAPSELVYGDLPRAIAMTGIRIWGLGWVHHYERTDPVSVEDVCAVCRLSRSQLYEHLGRLVDSHVLRYVRDTAGRFVFHFSGTGQQARAGPSPENRIGDGNTVVVVPSNPLEGDQQQQVVSGIRGGYGGGGGESGKPDEADQARERETRIVLAEMGVMEPTRSELASLGWVTPAYLRRWENWLEESFPGITVGLVIMQIRTGGEAPLTEAERRRQHREELGILT